MVREAAARAVGEDVGPADVTSRLIPAEQQGTAILLTREPCVLAGMDVAEAVFREVDGNLKWKALAKDGDQIEAGQGGGPGVWIGAEYPHGRAVRAEFFAAT